MPRPRAYTIAAILQLVVCGSIVALTLPNLTHGPEQALEGSSRYVDVIAFSTGLVGLVGVYGVWRNMRWGKVLTLAIDAIAVLLFVPPLFILPPLGKLVSAAYILIFGLIIVLLLWRTPAPAMAKT